MKSPKGFSLIETLVAIAILALLIGIAVPSISSYFRFSLHTALRDLSHLVRATYHTALMSGQVHRLVYDFKTHQYWVEVGPKDFLFSRKPPESKAEQDAKKEPSFRLAQRLTRKKKSLPQGVQFLEIQTEETKKPLSQGKAYTHFFPQGLSEATTLTLSNRSKQKVTFKITPTLGKSEIEQNDVSKSKKNHP